MPDGVLPAGVLPRFLSRSLAAAYLGVSVRTFDEEVAAGRWPAADRRGAKGGSLTWDRILLDRYADIRAGLALAAAQVQPGPTPEEIGEQEALRRAKAFNDRPKNGRAARH